MVRRKRELKTVQHRFRLRPLVRQLMRRSGTGGPNRLYEGAICAIVVSGREIAGARRLVAALVEEPVSQRVRLLGRDHTTLMLLEGRVGECQRRSRQ